MQDVYLFALVFGSLLAGMSLEQRRARWAKRRWLAKKGAACGKGDVFHIRKSGPPPAADPAEQLRIVMGAEFEKRRLLSRPEARVFYAAEKAVREAKLAWRVMAQVSLGEILSSPDSAAYAAINSKRVDILLISSGGIPIAAVEYQGEGHYQGTAAARDAVKKEALRKAGIRYIEVTPEHDPDDLVREIARIAKLEQAGV